MEEQGKSDSLPHVLIVGGGFAGLNVARKLCRRSVRITLIDRRNHHLFQPLLYQVATASLSPSDIAVPIRNVLRNCENVRVVMGEASRVDFAAKQLITRTGEKFSYDYLVVAAGAKTNYFGNDTWMKHAPGLKSIPDAIAIRERILKLFEAAEREKDPARRNELLSFVVIGGGPTGVEMAGAISELSRQTLESDFRNIRPDDIRVTLVEMADRVLTPFDQRLSRRAQEQLEELRVQVVTGAKVKHVDEGGVQVTDSFIPASFVCWATGVTPVALAAQLQVPLARGAIQVQSDCSLQGHPEVYAIGDIAHYVPEGSNRPLPGLAPVAIQQGRYVAKAILRRIEGRSVQPFRYVDKGIMATVGRSRAVAQSGRLRLSGMLAWLAWLFIHVLYLIDYRNRMFVMLNWFWSYVTFKRGARLITQRW